MPISSTDLNKAYLAYFGRPSDISGRATYANKEAADVVSAFDSSAESKALYGDSIVNKINAIYVNLFNRDAEPAGLQHWLSKVMSGELTPAGVAIAILNGAQNDDAKAVANKLAAADAFTKAIDTSAEILGYSGMAAVNSARAFLKTVDATEASLTAAVKDADAAVAAATNAGSAQANQGQTLTLTTGQDNIAGTAGNDTILGVFDGGATSNQNTLTAADVINGGAGKDSLMATLDVGSGGVLPAAQYSNIENFFIRNVSGVNPGNTFNFASYSGEEQVWNDRSSNAVNVTGLAAGTTVGVKGNGAVVAGATNATYDNAATAANIVLDGGIATGSAAVTVNGGAGMTSATLTSTGAANSIGGLTLAAATTGLTVDAQSNVTTGNIAGAGLTTVTVKGAGSANIGNLTASPAVTTVNAADNAGGVTATLNGQTNFKFTGGAGNDVVTTGAVLVATASVDAGAGTADRLVVANTNHIRVDGTSKALGDLYKGFEQVQVQDGVNLNVANLSTNNTIDTVRINDTSGTTSVTGISAAAAQNVTILNAQGAITIGLAGATTTGQIDTVKAAVTTTTAPVAGPQNVSLQSVNLAGVENLELTGSNGPIAANVGSIFLDTTNAIDLASIKLNNANAVDNNGANDNIIVVSAGSRAINLNIDATGSGDTVIFAANYNTITGATLTTGAGNDLIIGSARADIISGGAGNDRLDGGDAVTVTPAVPTPDSVVYDLSALAAVQVGDTAAVTINGTTYTGTAVLASAANLAQTLAAQIQADIGTNAVLGSVSVNGSVVTVNAATPGAASTLFIGPNVAPSDLTYVTDPAAVPLAAQIDGAGDGAVTAVDAAAATATLTFGTAAATFSAADVIAITLTDGAANSQDVSVDLSTAPAGTIVAGDPVATAANVAALVATAINATAGVSNTYTAVRTGNVVTLTSGNAGATGADASWTVTTDVTAPIVNTATGVTINQTSEGVDAAAQTVSVDFAGLTFATGDVVTVTFNEGSVAVPDVETLSFTVGAATTAADVAAGLAALTPGGMAATLATPGAGSVLTIEDGSVAGATAVILNPTVSIDRIPVTTTPVAANVTEGTDGVPVTAVTAAADRLSGGEGNDVFVVNYSNIDAAGTDRGNQVTFSAMDTITDLNLGGNVAGTNVDTIDLAFAVGTLVNAGAPVAMASTAADLYDAVQALYATGGTMASAAAGTAGLFTYGGNTYLIADQNGFVDGFAQTDVIINVTGVTGTLNLTDLV